MTVLQVTPALVRQLPESVITSRLLGSDSCVRVLAFGGEACPSLDVLAQWKSPKVQVHIHYSYYSSVLARFEPFSKYYSSQEKFKA